MKSNKIFVCLFTLAILCVSLTGCVSSRVEPLGNGYEEVVYTRTSISEPEATRISLQYRKGWHTVVIWPSMEGCIIKNDIAVFIGLMGNHESKLFAVKAPGPLLDITDEVLGRWSKESGKDFVEALKVASISHFQERGDALEFHFTFWARNDWPRVVILNWDQISDVMREVKEKGVVRKDLRWGTTYIQKEFKPEVQK
jgi:hypothetical protein